MEIKINTIYIQIYIEHKLLKKRENENVQVKKIKSIANNQHIYGRYILLLYIKNKCINKHN